MASVATATVLPVSEYLATSYRPDCEYLDGVLLERNVGEWDHSRLQQLLSRYMGNREKEWGVLVVTEQRVQVTGTRWRIPDLAVVTGVPRDGRIIDEPPFLCIELLSPSDRMTEMQERIDDYLRFGVRYVWLINPVNRRAFVYTADGMHEVRDGVLRASNPDIAVPLAGLE
jgi:Uma2 family endonuclease